MHANLAKNHLAGTTESPKMLEAMFSIGSSTGQSECPGGSLNQNMQQLMSKAPVLGRSVDRIGWSQG
jgi:hypothetical protein